MLEYSLCPTVLQIAPGEIEGAFGVLRAAEMIFQRVRRWMRGLEPRYALDIAMSESDDRGMWCAEFSF